MKKVVQGLFPLLNICITFLKANEDLFTRVEIYIRTTQTTRTNKQTNKQTNKHPNTQLTNKLFSNRDEPHK